MKLINLFSRYFKKANFGQTKNLNLVQFIGKSQDSTRTKIKLTLAFVAAYNCYLYLQKNKNYIHEIANNFVINQKQRCLPVFYAKEKNKPKSEQDTPVGFDDDEESEV